MFVFLLVFYIKASYVYALICSGSTTPSYVLTNYPINGVLSSTQTNLDVCACENLCLSDANCIAIDFNNGICNLVASSTSSYVTQGTVSNQACVNQVNDCTGTYQFNQYQNYALKGYARQTLTTTTIDQCYSACLNSVTLYGFNCTSGMWFDSTDCILNLDNQFTQASSFAYDPTNGDYYFDRICTPDCLTTTTVSTTAPTTTTASTTAPTTSQCCQIGGFWSDWTNSGTCNDTCGSCGQILRTRTCLSSTWCPCSGPSTRLDNCNIAPCAYPRLSCCTPYKAISINNNIICGPQPTPFEPTPIVTGCMPDCCPAQGVWSQWSDPVGCSDTCGACGVATRQRYCMTSGNGCPCNGNDIQSVPCNLTPCKYPRNSCCIGKVHVMNESMICTVPTSTSTESPASLDCASSCCPSGGTWSAWSTSQTCSDTCGSCGQLTYTRTCTSEPTCPCSGDSSKSVNCNLTPCQFPRTSCCGSYKAMVVGGEVICGPQPIESSDTESLSSPSVCTSTSIPISTSTLPTTTTSVATTTPTSTTTSTSTPTTTTSTSTPMTTTSTNTPMTTSTSTPTTTTSTSTPMTTTSTSTSMTTSTSTPTTTTSTSTVMTTTTSCTCAQAQIPTTNNTNVSVSPNQATYTCGTRVYYYCNSTNNYNPCYYTSYQYPNGTVTTASIYCGGAKGYSYRYETCNSQYMFITFTCLYVDCRRFPC